jgi:hypothetical protein
VLGSNGGHVVVQACVACLSRSFSASGGSWRSTCEVPRPARCPPAANTRPVVVAQWLVRVDRQPNIYASRSPCNPSTIATSQPVPFFLARMLLTCCTLTAHCGHCAVMEPRALPKTKVEGCMCSSCARVGKEALLGGRAGLRRTFS